MAQFTNATDQKGSRNMGDGETFSWQRNVRDQYKSWTTEAIKADLKAKALPCAILMAQVEHDFNIGSVIRNANAFGCTTVYYYGRKHIDRRGTCGTYHYCDVVHLPSFDQIRQLKEQYAFVALENNVPNTVPLAKFIYPKCPLLIIGEEQNGIEPALLELAEHRVEIEMRGSVRSLNAGAAAGIILYDFVCKQEL